MEATIWGLKLRVPSSGRVPIIRIRVFWDLYWGPLILGKLPYLPAVDPVLNRVSGV